MSSPATPPPDVLRGLGYETRDVDPKVIALLVGSIALIVGGAMIGLHFLMIAHAAATRAQSAELVTVDQTPPKPHLQTTPTGDFETFVVQQEEQLHSYGWIDRQKGVVHIPVERAMDLAVKDGLQLPAQSSTDQQPPSDEPSAETQE